MYTRDEPVALACRGSQWRHGKWRRCKAGSRQHVSRSDFHLGGQKVTASDTGRKRCDAFHQRSVQPACIRQRCKPERQLLRVPKPHWHFATSVLFYVLAASKADHAFSKASKSKPSCLAGSRMSPSVSKSLRMAAASLGITIGGITTAPWRSACTRSPS